MLRDQVRLVVALVLVLGVATAWRVRRAEPAPPAGEVRVANVQIDQIRTIAVHGATSWRLEKVDDRWWVVEGGRRLPADSLAAHELADAVVEAGEGLLVPEAVPSEIGLDDPIRVEVAAEGVWRFEVGDDAPVGRRTWLRVEGIGVVAVQGGIGVAVRGDPDDLVQAAVWAGETLDEVQLVGPEGAFVARREGSAWVGGPSPAATEAWAQGWSDVSLRAQEVPAEPPTHRLTMVGGGVTLRAELGRGPDGWWLRADDGRAGPLDVDVSGWVSGFRQEP